MLPDSPIVGGDFAIVNAMKAYDRGTFEHTNLIPEVFEDNACFPRLSRKIREAFSKANNSMENILEELRPMGAATNATTL